MFDGKKFVTRGVANELHPILQQVLWNMIFSIPCTQDYLQVFDLSPGVRNGRPTQIIAHHQEIPTYSNRYEIPFPTPVSVKVFVIDDEDYATMLYPEER